MLFEQELHIWQNGKNLQSSNMKSHSQPGMLANGKKKSSNHYFKSDPSILYAIFQFTVKSEEIQWKSAFPQYWQS